MRKLRNAQNKFQWRNLQLFLLIKHFTSFYQQVNLLKIYFKFLCIAYTEVAIKLLLITYINIQKYLQIDNKNIYYFYYQLQYINKYYER